MRMARQDGEAGKRRSSAPVAPEATDLQAQGGDNVPHHRDTEVRPVEIFTGHLGGAGFRHDCAPRQSHSAGKRLGHDVHHAGPTVLVDVGVRGQFEGAGFKW